MINLNPDVVSELTKIGGSTSKLGTTAPKGINFTDAVKVMGKYISKVDEHQQSSDESIKQLLSGKNEDIISVVTEVSKADMSFKLLVGVRNKLIEAYKQTMNMSI